MVGRAIAWGVIGWAVFGGVAGCGSKTENAPDGGASGGGVSGGPSPEPILDAGGQVAVPPDGASLCPPGICNYQTGQGCSGSVAPSCVPLPATDGAAGVAPA